MALKSSLNAEMKRLKGDAKKLAKKRDEITADIDAKIAENARMQEMLQAFMDASFGAKAKPTVVAKAGSSGKRRKRQNRSGVREGVLDAINNSSGGMKRNAIIAALGMSDDKPGHQYVSNTLRDLFNDGHIEKRGRVYFPSGSGQTTSGITAPVSETSSAADEEQESSSESSGGGSSTGSGSIGSSFSSN